jgi:hypothetical protein
MVPMMPVRSTFESTPVPTESPAWRLPDVVRTASSCTGPSPRAAWTCRSGRRCRSSRKIFIAKNTIFVAIASVFSMKPYGARIGPSTRCRTG